MTALSTAGGAALRSITEEVILDCLKRKASGIALFFSKLIGA
jgi:hypothetical protein